MREDRRALYGRPEVGAVVPLAAPASGPGYFQGSDE